MAPPRAYPHAVRGACEPRLLFLFLAAAENRLPLKACYIHLSVYLMASDRAPLSPPSRGRRAAWEKLAL